VAWSHNECVGRTRDLSNICRDLKELVCERVHRLNGPRNRAKARFVCEKVGLRSSYESSEEEFDYWFASAAKAQADKPSTTPGTTGNVTYNVFRHSCPRTTEEEQQGKFQGLSALMEPQAPDIGTCQNLGAVRRNNFNSIEVLGCTDRCLW
jgi:hypothetical protein